MMLQDRHHNERDEYAYCVMLEFEDLQRNVGLEVPAQGRIRITLSEEFPYPVTVAIKEDMIDGENDDASYVEFDRLRQTVADSSESPIEFRFLTKPAPPADRHGAKVYSFKASEYNPDAAIPSTDDSDIIEHHIGIPSSQRVRLLASLINAIDRGEAEAGDIQKMMNVYDTNRSSAVEKFYDDIKKYGSFEAEISVLSFFMDTGDIYRDYSATVNKVAKQVTRERLRRQLESAEDVRRFVSIINSEDSLPEITVEEVFDRVYERVDGNNQELKEIAEDLDTHNWHSLYSI